MRNEQDGGGEVLLKLGAETSAFWTIIFVDPRLTGTTAVGRSILALVIG